MQTLESLKRSINSAEDLAGVVRTMKAMAAVSIRQYETATESLSVYARTINLGLRMLLKTSSQHELAGPDVSTGTIGPIVFGSDQGMCGQFNEQLAQFVQESLRTSATDASGVAPALCVGHRASGSLENAAVSVRKTFYMPGSATGITPLVQDLLPAIDQWREEMHVGRIVVFHNRRLSASSWRPDALQLLPLQLDQPLTDSAEDSQPAGRSLPLWNMDTNLLFSRLVKQFLFVSLFRACAESLAGENASRIAAMQAAERNIRDRLYLLRSDYAQRRQTTITEELLDVVTGFEALSQKS